MGDRKKDLRNKPHRGFVVYRAGLPNVVRLPCLRNAHGSNAKGVALSLLTRVFVCQMPHINIQIGRQRNTRPMTALALYANTAL